MRFFDLISTIKTSCHNDWHIIFFSYAICNYSKCASIFLPPPVELFSTLPPKMSRYNCKALSIRVLFQNGIY